MIQDQSLVGSKHFLVETEDKNLADPAVHVHPEHGYGHPKGHRKADADPPVVHPEHGHRKADAKLPYAKLRSPLDKTGDDYGLRSGGWGAAWRPQPLRWCRGRWSRTGCRSPLPMRRFPNGEYIFGK